MPLELLVHSGPLISAAITDCLTDLEVHRGSVASASLHHSLKWVAEEGEGPVSLETLPLEVTERLHKFIDIDSKSELTAASLTCWKLFATEFSLAPQTCLSKYLSDPLIEART